ncbi:hypothetical protein WN48_04042 [Eufriesea mexicana]|uniref:Uncharacterized protein n=1 Tax=Eufriesea mexicana TaxID=516756 RepID=A0A310SET8_9HYME|nr:hypothetical protein WN48_04042 [Eufriesea mexicana]
MGRERSDGHTNDGISEGVLRIIFSCIRPVDWVSTGVGRSSVKGLGQDYIRSMTMILTSRLEYSGFWNAKGFGSQSRRISEHPWNSEKMSAQNVNILLPSGYLNYPISFLELEMIS